MTKHVYTKEEFEAMWFERKYADRAIANKRFDDGVHFLWMVLACACAPQGPLFWRASYCDESDLTPAQSAELQNMVQQYDALYGEATS